MQAVGRVEEPGMAELVEWFRAGGTPCSGLRDNLINVTLGAARQMRLVEARTGGIVEGWERQVPSCGPCSDRGIS